MGDLGITLASDVHFQSQVTKPILLNCTLYIIDELLKAYYKPLFKFK